MLDWQIESQKLRQTLNFHWAKHEESGINGYQAEKTKSVILKQAVQRLLFSNWSVKSISL